MHGSHVQVGCMQITPFLIDTQARILCQDKRTRTNARIRTLRWTCAPDERDLARLDVLIRGVAMV
jgi:hypothetical protein